MFGNVNGQATAIHNSRYARIRLRGFRHILTAEEIYQFSIFNSSTDVVSGKFKIFQEQNTPSDSVS